MCFSFVNKFLKKISYKLSTKFFTESEIGISHQRFIHSSGSLSSFPDCPDNKRLSSAHISCCKYTRNRRSIAVRSRLHIGSFIYSYLKSICHIFLASQKSGCDQNQIGSDHFLRSLGRNHDHPFYFAVQLSLPCKYSLFCRQ